MGLLSATGSRILKRVSHATVAQPESNKDKNRNNGKLDTTAEKEREAHDDDARGRAERDRRDGVVR